ncbi:ABC transporter permease subunit [Novipirellula artificiosorum]|uniref:ABC-2 family transporter protein n=1 Tax=Novipirellula artificiosorum TaxID=2528016 RepID=A0A5C6E062_9BACT|nr:ABC transporter permease subunit [Novipirellula artificiosorum]TWU42105.1 ABC-2 family transporter protein [Novipirellula artificiosorum]
MPVNDLGYRAWSGKRVPPFLRPVVVAKSGIALVWRRRWLRTMLMLAWLPVIFPALGIFAFEYSSTDPQMGRMITTLVRGPFQQPDLAQMIATDRDGARHAVWSTLILAFFRYPQLFAMVLLIGLIAPMLVSYDLRTKAYLLYFSRPLSPLEYILGKSSVIWFLLMMIATVPALVLYLVGVLLSPDLSVIGQTWDIPLRIVAASAVLMIPTTALALCYSSLTAESRYATFGWFATWTMGFVSYQILTFAPMVDGPPEGRRAPRPIDWESLGIDLDRYRLLSPYHTLGKVQAWVFDLDPTPGRVMPAIVVLMGITIIGFWIVRRRLIRRLSV